MRKNIEIFITIGTTKHIMSVERHNTSEGLGIGPSQRNLTVAPSVPAPSGDVAVSDWRTSTQAARQRPLRRRRRLCAVMVHQKNWGYPRSMNTQSKNTSFQTENDNSSILKKNMCAAEWTIRWYFYPNPSTGPSNYSPKIWTNELPIISRWHNAPGTEFRPPP